MKKAFLFLISVCLVLCFLKAYVSNVDAIPKTIAVVQNKTNNDCQEWQYLYNDLSDNQRSELPVNGIASGRKGYLIGSQLVPDCRQRLKIGDYLNKVIFGRNDEFDSDFINRNSKEIISVVKSTWQFYSDGASEEKYLILIDKNLRDEDLEPFIGQLIEKEGLNPADLDSGLFYALFTRQLPGLKPIIARSLDQAERDNDLVAQIYALYLLYRDTSEQKYFRKMKAVSKKLDFSGDAKLELNKIISKIELNKSLDYDDFDSFSIAVLKAEPVFENQGNK